MIGFFRLLVLDGSDPCSAVFVIAQFLENFKCTLIVPVLEFFVRYRILHGKNLLCTVLIVFQVRELFQCSIIIAVLCPLTCPGVPDGKDLLRAVLIVSQGLKSSDRFLILALLRQLLRILVGQHVLDDRLIHDHRRHHQNRHDRGDLPDLLRLLGRFLALFLRSRSRFRRRFPFLLQPDIHVLA